MDLIDWFWYNCGVMTHKTLNHASHMRLCISYCRVAMVRVLLSAGTYTIQKQQQQQKFTGTYIRGSIGWSLQIAQQVQVNYTEADFVLPNGRPATVLQPMWHVGDKFDVEVFVSIRRYNLQLLFCPPIWQAQQLTLQSTYTHQRP